MGPIASKLAKELRKASRNAVIDLATLREARQLQREIESAVQEPNDLPPNHAAWMRVFKVLASLAHVALGTSALRKLAERVDAADEEYMPGGPPSSPILDSVFMSWWMADLGAGPIRESMCSILADIGPAMNFPPELSRYARVFAESRMGVYRLTELGADRVALVELLTNTRVEARLPADLHGRGPLWLTRLLPPIVPHDQDWVVWTTPYLLDGPDYEAEWRAYCERAVAGALPSDRAERFAWHFKAGDDPRRWTEYIMNGYAGVTEVGEIALCGIPDRPKTLPQHPDYDVVAAADPHDEATPLQRLRIRLHALANERGFANLAADDMSGTQADSKAEPQFPEVHRLMALAYKMYGQLDRDGHSAVDMLLREPGSLPIEEMRELEALAAGWFSAFEILHVRVDEGLELRDVFGGRKLWITERAATRQVERGDVLACWVMVEGERNTLDGAICHVPARLTDPFVSALRGYRNELERKHPNLDWKKRNGLLARRVAPLLEAVFADAPMPTLVNHDGDNVLFSGARYDVEDPQRVALVLEERFRALGEGVFEHVASDVVVARLTLRDRVLELECNSKQRLTSMKSMLKKALGKALKHRVDMHQDPQALLSSKEARRRSAASPSPLQSLPPEARAQIQAMMLERMRQWLDEPVPMLDGKTPRQAAQSQRGRDDVAHMLVRQQQIFAAGPGLPPIDLREIWTELGLQPRA